MRKINIAASILSADFSNLYEELRFLPDEGVSYLHFDVMDGHFVNNISFGSYVLKCLAFTPLIKDVHLMIEEPKKYYLDFINAGADIITFHYEAVEESSIKSLIDEIHQHNIKVGISIKPNTKVDSIKEFLEYLDLVLVMSVEPGFGGQSYLKEVSEKIAYLKFLKDKYNYKYIIEVDGGINDKTAFEAINSGAEVLVSGSYLFKAKNRKEAVKKLIGE